MPPVIIEQVKRPEGGYVFYNWAAKDLSNFIPVSITVAIWKIKYKVNQLTEAISSINSESIFSQALKQGAAQNNMQEVVKMVKDQLNLGHRMAIVGMVGEQVVTLIEEYDSVSV